MKKLLFFFSVLLLTIVSCSKTDPQTKPDSGNDPEPQEKTYDFTYIITGDLEGKAMNLMFSNIEVEYKNAQGEMIKETITSLPWKLTVSKIKAPFTAELFCNVSLKSQEEIDAITQEPPYKLTQTLPDYSFTASDGSEHVYTNSTSILPVGSKEDVIRYIQEKVIGKIKPLKVELK